MSEEKLSITDFHVKFAKQLFNETWDLIDKQDKSNEDIFNMIHKAHASRYHWSIIGEPVNLARGEWQISRVYCIANMGESALMHAKEYLRYCEQCALKPFDYAFAYESLARALVTKGLKDEAMQYLKIANDWADKIINEDNRYYVKSEIMSISTK